MGRWNIAIWRSAQISDSGSWRREGEAAPEPAVEATPDVLHLSRAHKRRQARPRLSSFLDSGPGPSASQDNSIRSQPRSQRPSLRRHLIPGLEESLSEDPPATSTPIPGDVGEGGLENLPPPDVMFREVLRQQSSKASLFDDHGNLVQPASNGLLCTFPFHRCKQTTHTYKMGG